MKLDRRKPPDAPGLFICILQVAVTGISAATALASGAIIMVIMITTGSGVAAIAEIALAAAVCGLGELFKRDLNSMHAQAAEDQDLTPGDTQMTAGKEVIVYLDDESGAGVIIGHKDSSVWIQAPGEDVSIEVFIGPTLFARLREAMTQAEGRQPL